MAVIVMRVRGLLRRGWRATLVLALVAGLAGGVAIAVVAAGHRTATVYDRLVEYADPAELLLNFCPPGHDLETGGLEPCYLYDAADERDLLAALPAVEEASRIVFHAVTVAPASDPDRTFFASTTLRHDPGVADRAGRHLVVSGRDATADDEIVLTESLSTRSGLEVGDEVEITFWAEDEFGLFTGDGAEYSGPAATVTVVGIGLSLADLGASAQAAAFEASGLFAGPGFEERVPGAVGFTSVLLEADDDDAVAATAAVESAFGDRIVNIAEAMEDDETAPAREAIRYEAQATRILGLVLALVAVALMGQALVRQSRREWDDGPLLRAIGMSKHDAGWAAVLRGTTIGGPAAVIAAVTAVLLSPFGPVGVGRAAEPDPGFVIDVATILLGSTVVFAVAVAATWVPLARGRALRLTGAGSTLPRARRTASMPPVVAAGLSLARTGRRGARTEVLTAVAGVGAAVVTVVAAFGLTSSLDDLLRTPPRFGAPWDVSIAGSSVAESARSIVLDDRIRPSVEAAAGITGADMRIGDGTVWVHAFVPVDGVDETIPVPVASGRLPTTSREILLGSVTLRDLGLAIGDTLPVTTTATDETFEMTIVGTTIINDTQETSPGRGGGVTPSFIAEAAPEAGSEPFIVTLTDGTDVEAFVEEVRSFHDGEVLEPRPQVAVSNIVRIRRLPYVLAAVVIALAIATFVHAMAITTSRSRRNLGVLRGLGFTRRQVVGAVTCQATWYTTLALAVAVPLGVAAGRVLWTLAAEGLGVPAVSVVPLLGTLVVIVGALAFANLAAAIPAWRTTRLTTAASLRSE